MSPESTPQRPTPAVTILIDAVLVVVFCLLGGLSHSLGEPDAAARVLASIWPFLAALIVVHAVALLGGIDAARVVPGILIWVVTVAGGMALRALTGQGTAWAFVVVTAIVLAVFLVGWRVVALLRRRRSR
ncbi:DUF3054 domain-containing protein [Microbacterium sp. CIAB417]|uniref:DUF3054 domain-containing protein n=1 Tax=Microbacterium sp. CIAB417 TaxID=2860287 RepID=UPI001FAB4AD4|nr:DUF3054 domain-containing protein [Microbacterium sp. CIAB417]